MEATLVLLRALHIGALSALFGGFVFQLWVAGNRTGRTTATRSTAKGFPSSAGWLVVAMLSGAGWLAFEAVSMSGLPLAQAVGRETLRTVLTQTSFGQVWIGRGVMTLTLAALLLAASQLSVKHQRTLLFLCTLVAAALLSSLAWVGHANSERGASRLIHLGADAVHLLAAGAWLGALVPLVAVLTSPQHHKDAATLDELARIVKRFSLLGLSTVGALIVTGAANAWFTVASISGLLMTRYGQLLLIKIALFGAMLVLATINRTRLTPRLADSALIQPARALVSASLGRNAIAEVALGVLVLGIVGALGTSMPAAHSSAMTPAMHVR